jgi:hypothetical protein
MLWRLAASGARRTCRPDAIGGAMTSPAVRSAHACHPVVNRIARVLDWLPSWSVGRS